jgi:hypothetical protein
VWGVLVANGWRPENIRMLVDDEATAANVRAGFRWLQQTSAPDTFSYFHYSGHVQRRNGHQMLWPVDNVYLPDTEVVAALRPVRGSAWWDFAGCHAGGFDDGLAAAHNLVTMSSSVKEKSFEHPDWGLSIWAGVLYDQALSRKLADTDRDGTVTMAEALRYAAEKAAYETRDQGYFGYSPQHPQVTGGLGTAWTLANPPTRKGATLPA